MNRKEALAQTRKLLTDDNIDEAALECEILLRHVLGLTRAQLFAALDNEISKSDINTLKKLVVRRITGEPSAYITGIKEFYGLEFTVNQHVLIPRPETELLVEQAIKLCREHKYKVIADIGTGCGAIAVSLAVNLSNIQIYATDISAQAIEVAEQNCIRHDVKGRITLLQGDLLEPLPDPVDVIVANLPYVRTTDIPKQGPLSFEPRIALDGGEKGLDKIEQLCRQAGDKLNPDGSLLLEIGQGQAEDIKIILHKYLHSGSIDVKKDLAGIERVIVLCLT